jgi:hypothetical protein
MSIHVLYTQKRIRTMNATKASSRQVGSTAYGRRPTLSDSIDRLDGILDGLSEAIPATIRATLRDEVAAAVAEGVRAALVEVLSGEAVQSLLRGAPPAAPVATPAPQPSLGKRLLAKATSALVAVHAWVGGTLQRVAAGPATVGREVWDGLTRAFRWLGWGWQWVKLLPVLTLVGGAATLGLAASGWWTSLRGGVAAVWAGLAALARRLFSRLTRPFGPLTT